MHICEAVKIFIDKVIVDLPPPLSTQFYPPGLDELGAPAPDEHKEYQMRWRKGLHSVTLNACEHMVTVQALFDDGGPVGVSRMAYFSHIRLKYFLKWMNAEGSIEDLNDLLSNGTFHQKFSSDPIWTENMYSGRIPVYLLNKILEGKIS